MGERKLMQNETRLIPLSQGKFAIVDATDFEFLNRWKWHVFSGNHRQKKKFYAVRNSKGPNKRIIFMHRALLKPGIGFEGDHKNGDSLDNRRENLRICTHLQNSQNSGMRHHNTSGFKGVSFHKKAGAWEAYICPNYKKKYLGLFSTKEEAAHAYDSAAKTCFGEFAILNFP